MFQSSIKVSNLNTPEGQTAWLTRLFQMHKITPEAVVAAYQQVYGGD